MYLSHISHASFRNRYLKNAYMINMRSILWGCVFFSNLRGETPLGCAIFFLWWAKHFLQFNGVPFQIKRIFFKIRSITFFSANWYELVLLSNIKRQLRQFSFWWVKHFLHMNGMHLERKGLFKEMVLLSLRTAGLLFWKECDIITL